MPHILFLMSDTGGGHRAASRAIEAALNVHHSGQFTTELVDVWKDYTPYPLNTMPDVYTPWINTSAGSYSALFWLNDNVLAPLPTPNRLYVKQMFPAMKRLFTEHPADVVVCVHSVFVRPAIYALRHMRSTQPFVTVITDYAWPTVMWYDPHVDRCLVPTPPAYERGLTLGLAPEQMRLTGAPVHPNFTNIGLTREEAKRQLGWDTTLPAVLMVGGGGGMGPLIETARAIDRRRLPCQLIIVTGRNEALKKQLESREWRRPTRVYGFVDNMHILMTAADVLVTKAGPATITEAALVGLPLVLSGAIRFQESPNTEYVVQQGAGVYAPGSRLVADSLAELLSDDGTRLDQLSTGIRKLARPNAIWEIADEIWTFLA